MPDAAKNIQNPLSYMYEGMLYNMAAIDKALDGWMAKEDERLAGCPVPQTQEWLQEHTLAQEGGQEPKGPQQVQDPEVATQGKTLQEHGVTQEGEAPTQDPDAARQAQDAEAAAQGKVLQEHGVTYEGEAPAGDLDVWHQGQDAPAEAYGEVLHDQGVTYDGEASEEDLGEMMPDQGQSGAED